MQRFLPHDVLIVAWGNFGKGDLRHDVISVMPGVRSTDANSKKINAFMSSLFDRWGSDGRQPLSLNCMDSGILAHLSEIQTGVGVALRKMRSALVHGIVDKRTLQDCLYVTFSGNATAADMGVHAMSRVMPYLDMALRRVNHLPHQLPESGKTYDQAKARWVHDAGLSQREFEVMQWVVAGKTNPEIGAILDISEFTIKNHLKRIFVKLNVINRVQAVGRFQSVSRHV